jgi:predicted glycosyltransferase
LRPATPRLKAALEYLEPHDEYVGWGKFNRHYWADHYEDFLEFFFSQCLTEPHSTKPREDTVGWGLDTDAEALIASQLAPRLQDEEGVRGLLARIDCPILVIHGKDDAVRPWESGARLAKLANAELAVLEGSGHLPHARDPVKVNLLLRDLVTPVPPRRRWTRSVARRRRALYISSPIGLGHAQRDVAIADELRKLHPDLEIDWLAQHPVTAVLEERSERIHRASAHLASESGHIAAESAGHSLHAFQAIRRMDEILVANFMVFHDVVTEGDYDLVIGDEAWDVDYYLHENPELKRTAFAWLTDFVGWLPMPVGGEREAFVTADYNAEMIEHIARLPRIRDRAIFVGNPDDIVPDDFGPGLPAIRDWTERHFAFSGYITGFDPAPLVEGREALRRELGYRPDERVVIVTVGGSGVGEALLRLVVAAYPEAARRVSGLRMIAVAGPRIDPTALDAPPGVEVRAFVPDLFRHLAACDLAVVQGGLTTTMELVAARRPFLYFPLADHFEQNRHVRHRLDRYGAGRYMAYDASPPEVIADAIASEIDRTIDYRPVEGDGAARAAALIAPLI